MCPIDKSLGGPLKVRYISAIIMEYIKCLFDTGIPLQPQLQSMFLGFLVQSKELSVLQQLLQFHILNDTVELAKMLIVYKTTYEAGLNLGLDMLQRLRMHSEIVLTLI